ncbi:nuclear transport factor 2 family protein [Christiangramia sp.]|jgi:ketosteroid isomerase-like protein|uniref:YybH family protein n=1 Tax=Christiangramia sp. TaxID=1931228 RepID=UPI00260727E8|nr:nuclear transport factor 2 family protein [Christiangramia sp.]
MKILKLSAILILMLLATGQIYSQNMDAEKEAVKSVMKNYKNAMQNLTTKGTFELFAKDSHIFESGGVEGSYANYIEHHIGPELGHFNKFEYSDYKIEVQVDAPYAFTTETYIYTIVTKPDENSESKTIKKKGVATSVLKKIDGNWKIIKMHSSSRTPKK